MTEEQLLSLSNHRDSDAFTELEKRVLDFAVACSSTPARVTDELVAELQKHFDSAQIVELAATIAWENYRARFNCAFGIESAGFSEGAICALPER